MIPCKFLGWLFCVIIIFLFFFPDKNFIINQEMRGILFCVLALLLLSTVTCLSTRVLPRRAPVFPANQPIATQAPCACSNQSWCTPLTSPKPAKELFVYTPNENEFATSYDWSKITTVVTYSLPHPQLVCFAHARGVRVVLAFGTDWKVAMDPVARQAYAASIAATAASHGLDGINMDFEQTLPTPLYSNYATALYFSIVELVRAANPIAQCSVCFASFSQEGYTYYQLDFSAILSVSDFLMAMMYDMSIHTVGPNSFLPSINYTFFGLYNLSSMPANKLVLGFPWYGYEYSCANGSVTKDNECKVVSSTEL